MPTIATSTIAALGFAPSATLDFPTLVGEFDDALRAAASDVEVTWEGAEDASGGTVQFDTGEVLISLVHRAGPAPALIIAVGARPDGTGCGPLFEGRWDLCMMLVGQIEALLPVERKVWLDIDRSFDDGARDRALALLARPQADRPQQKAVPRPTHPALPADRRLARPEPDAPILIADDPAPMPDWTEELRSLRAALHAEDDMALDPRRQPVPHRAAIYTMNAALMVVALPVGAAMLTYCALGRENLSSVARVMALTGSGLGLVHDALPFLS